MGARLGFEKAKMRFLAFYDTGRLSRNAPQPGEQAHVSLDSTGVGMRMSYGVNFTARIDFAQVLHDGSQFGVTERSPNRWHFSLGYVF